MEQNASQLTDSHRAVQYGQHLVSTCLAADDPAECDHGLLIYVMLFSFLLYMPVCVMFTLSGIERTEWPGFPFRCCVAER